MNLALYGPGGRWAMTERGAGDLVREGDAMAIGPSAMRWVGETLRVDLDEWCVPLPRRLRGRLTVHPCMAPAASIALDAAQRHAWQPIAARARIEVQFDTPALRWSGEAYLDSNRGSVPLEHDFADWTWSRAPIGTDACAALYDVRRRDGSELSLALRFGADGHAEPFAPPRPAPLPRTRWALPRATRSDAAARVLQTVEDAPFYARSIVAARWLGQDVRAFHESLSLDRFDTPWMRLMLPFRMPRRARR